MAELPPWCTDSTALQAFVAKPFEGGSPERKLAHTMMAGAIAEATKTFMGTYGTCWEEDFTRQDYSIQEGWHGLANSLALRFRRVHWQMVTADTGYATAVGTSIDAYRRSLGEHVPKSTSKRHKQEVHEIMAKAAVEGFCTAVALYEVVPRCVRLRKPEMELTQQLVLSQSLLPQIGQHGILQARLSRQGNDTRLQHIAFPSAILAGGSPNYKHLSFRPEAFDIVTSNNGKSRLTETYDNHEATDLRSVFRGCPAVHKRSVTSINNLIASIVLQRHTYEQVLG